MCFDTPVHQCSTTLEVFCAVSFVCVCVLRDRMVAQEAIIADFLQICDGTLLPASVPCVASFPFVLFPCVKCRCCTPVVGGCSQRTTEPRNAFFRPIRTQKSVLGMMVCAVLDRFPQSCVPNRNGPRNGPPVRLGASAITTTLFCGR